MSEEIKRSLDRANLLLCAKLDMNSVPVISDAKFLDRYGFNKWEWDERALHHVSDGSTGKPYDNEDTANFLIGKLGAEFGGLHRSGQQVTDEFLGEIRARIASLLIERGINEFPEIEVRRTRLDTVEIRAPGVYGMRLELSY